MSLDVTLWALRRTEVYDANITHNLGKMADEAGVYEYLWKPNDIGIHKAVQLVPHLERGLRFLRADPERYRKLEPDNGWGRYEDLVHFIERYIVACNENPDADVYTHR